MREGKDRSSARELGTVDGPPSHHRDRPCSVPHTLVLINCVSAFWTLCPLDCQGGNWVLTSEPPISFCVLSFQVSRTSESGTNALLLCSLGSKTTASPSRASTSSLWTSPALRFLLVFCIIFITVQEAILSQDDFIYEPLKGSSNVMDLVGAIYVL